MVPEQEKDNNFSFLPWAILPTIISVAAAYAYVLSCLYFLSVSVAFDFPVSDYLDFIDYVQFFPQLWVDIYAAFLLFCLLAYSYGKILKKHAKPISRTRRLKRPLWMRRCDACVRVLIRRYVLVSVSFLKALFLFSVVFCLPLYALLGSGNDLRREVIQKKMSEVFRKGQPCPIEGQIFLRGSRYILLLDKSDLVTAIPQPEVPMIQAKLNSPLYRGTSPASSVPSAITATPSPISSTPTPSPPKPRTPLEP
jgi:hypothetical protein